MDEVKKKVLIFRLLFLLTALSFFCVILVALKDFSLSQGDRFERAQTAEQAGAFRQAERYYLMAVDGDDESVSKVAAYYLGVLYKKGGTGFTPNAKQAVVYLERAAQLGLPQAQYELALLYDVGDKIPENREKALAWMKKSAEQGFADALYGLGVWMEREYMGKPDMEQVVSLYERAAEQNHVPAMTGLISLYAGGAADFASNQEKALYWMNKVAELKRPK